MESGWMLWPGQTLEDTKISDRKKVLHISSESWRNIRSHLDKKRLAEEAIAKERAKKKAMKEESKAMVDQWPNSIMNLFRLQKEERMKDIEAKQEEKTQRYFELRKDQEIVRQKFVDEMRQKVYRKTGFPREIDVALGTAEVIYERKKQIEIKRLLEQRLREVEAEFAKKVQKGVVDEKKEKEEKARKQRERNEKFAKLYLKEVKEKKEKEEQKKKARTEVEIMDNINAAKEMKDIEKVRRQELQEYKNVIGKRLKNHRSMVNERKRIDEEEDKDKDKIVAVQVATRDRFDCLVKKKKKELQDIFIARTVAISGIVPAIEKEKAEHEKKLLDRVEEEKLKESDQKEEEKIKYTQRLRKERIADHAGIVQRREKKEADQMEAKKWEMVNRYKNTEYSKEHNQKRAAAKWKNVLAYRKDLQDQMAEKREVLKNEELKDEAFFKQEKEKIEAQDKQFFEYADQVKGIIKSRGGRTTVPLEKVVEGYKKINNLPYRVERPCERVSAKCWNKPGKVAYDRDSDPNYMKANWKLLYE